MRDKGDTKECDHTQLVATPTGNGGQALLCNIKSTPEGVQIYNDVKSDLIVYMITNCMFPSADECVVQAHEYIHASQERRDIEDFNIDPAFIKKASILFKLLSQVCNQYILSRLYMNCLCFS